MASVMLLLQDLKLQCSMGMHRRAKLPQLSRKLITKERGLMDPLLKQSHGMP